MQLDPVGLMISFVFGIIGTGFFIYGRKQSRFWTMIAGIALGVYPFFVSDLWMMLLVGVVLTAVPFLTSD
jgi:hypothetical protein